MTTFPLRVSPNGRYLEDAAGDPFFIHAEAGWDIFQAITFDDARMYLDDRVARGFNGILTTVMADDWHWFQTYDGLYPFETAWDITRPNEAYWARVDRVFAEIEARGLLHLCNATWLGAGRPMWRDAVTLESVPQYGRFLAERYGRYQNVIWMQGGDRLPENPAAVDLLARTMKEIAPHQLQTYHSENGHSSSEHFGDAGWLDVNSAYTYCWSYLQVGHEYARRRPARPLWLSETGYEDEPNHLPPGQLWTPFMVRRQAWWALTSGACGHAYGSRTVWGFFDGWKDELDKPGIRSFPHVRSFFEGIAWWTLEPDDDLVLEGGGGYGEPDHVTAARSPDGALAVVYLPQPSIPLRLDMRRLAAAATARWYNPRQGSSLAAGAGPSYAPPTYAHEHDWVLLITG